MHLFWVAVYDKTEHMHRDPVANVVIYSARVRNSILTYFSFWWKLTPTLVSGLCQDQRPLHSVVNYTTESTAYFCYHPQLHFNAQVKNSREGQNKANLN